MSRISADSTGASPSSDNGVGGAPPPKSEKWYVDAEVYESDCGTPPDMVVGILLSEQSEEEIEEERRKCDPGTETLGKFFYKTCIQEPGLYVRSLIIFENAEIFSCPAEKRNR